MPIAALLQSPSFRSAAVGSQPTGSLAALRTLNDRDCFVTYASCITGIITILPKKSRDSIDRLGLAEAGERKSAHVRFLDLPFRHVDHAARYIRFGIAVRAADFISRCQMKRISVCASKPAVAPQVNNLPCELQRANRRIPGVAAGEVDADVHALLAADVPGLAGKIVLL